jgi:putative membrane-bound dehydrogenase-like protein
MIRPLLAAIVLAATPTLARAGEPSSLKVLFLGDRGHHRPADRAAQLIPVMALRGVDVTYTEKTSDLNPETLAKYDALIVYANTTRIEPAQEKALLDYVEGGRGFVPLHCASYCFLNSPAYIALVGAQFQRHGTGEFDTRIVDADHPIMKGFQPFRTWDETYVHTKHNEKDRQVLQVRQEGSREEPWTWVRTQGKGRIFYTAYGHDERTWGQPGFQDLVERGIRWAAQKGEVFDSRPRVASGLKPFKYTESEAGIPNYVPGARWGTQAEPIRRMQLPVEPAESVKHMALPHGFTAKLFAAEPDIAKPICLAWDHRGRLWIAETTDYPNNRQPSDQGHDRIKICEDTDGDGRADKFTVFAENLSIPTSIAFARGGVIVHQLPETLFLKDSDGDGKADVKEVLFRGWGTGDTHAGPSNLRYGLDNWLYGIVGYSGFRGKVGDEELRFGQGFYRFKPDGSKLEFLRSTNNNSWGVGFSEEGLLFGSTANGCPSVFVPIVNRYYEMVRGSSARVLRSIADSNRFYPVTDKVRQVDWFGGFTAGAGHALYTARAFPKGFWNRTAFVCEPTGHLAATFTLEERGADFAAHNALNIVASDDEWTSPVAAEVGPDGALWFIDWYNFIVQHNPTPQGFRTGRGAAYETPLRDKTHGRIYRIVYEAGKPTAPVRLDENDPKTLVAGLKSDNQLWRMHAQRLLVERGQRDVIPDLAELLRNPSVDEIGLNTAAIHAAWVLHALGAFADGGAEGPAKSAANEALTHPSAGVRRNAVLVLPRTPATASRLVALNLLGDRDPQVRLATLLTLSEVPASAEVATALVKAISSWPSARPDRVLIDAATAAASAHDREFLRAVAAQKPSSAPGEPILTVADRIAEHFARGGNGEPLPGLIAALESGDPRIAEAVIAGFARGWPAGRTAKFDEATERSMTRLASALSPAARGRLVSLAARWGSQGLAKYAADIAKGFLATARDESRSETSRATAARQLIELSGTQEQAIKDVLDLITPRTTPTLATGLVEAVGHSEAPSTGALLAEQAGALTPGVRQAALRVLLGRSEWTAALLDAVDQGKIRVAELSLDQKQALSNHPDRRIAARARRMLASGGGLPDADRQKVIDSLAPIVLKGGDPARGKVVFREQCAKCHAYAGEGGKVGPDLTGIAAHPKEELLINVLDPSRSVEGNFVQYTVATTDGRVLNGLLASETKTTVELLDAEGKSQVLQRADIEELRASKKSLMPEGFEKQVNAQQITDLIAFLSAKGKYLPLDLRKAATVASDRGMFTDPDASVERLVFPDWSPKVVDGVPFQLIDPRGGKVFNTILLNGPQGSIPPKMPKSVELACHAPARAIHLLGAVAGWASPFGEKGSTSLIVRLRYADGRLEDHPLRNGEEIADYIRVVNVPGSKLAFNLAGRQVRYVSVRPRRPDTIEAIELVKGPDDTAPVIMAVTVEVADAQ